MANSIPDSGHNFAQLLAASVMTAASRSNEQWNGFSQAQLLQDLSRLDSMADLADKMRAIAAHVLRPQSIR